MQTLIKCTTERLVHKMLGGHHHFQVEAVAVLEKGDVASLIEEMAGQTEDEMLCFAGSPHSCSATGCCELLLCEVCNNVPT
ncbi:hypothetical protein AOLI_G00326960 [Acnodon oligacanthus]